jgi:hypothetical protein
VRLLQLQVASADDTARVDPTLDATTTSLGHAGLRLQWTAASAARALDAGDAAGAVRLYRTALPVLRHGDSLFAHDLHAVGARALSETGDDSAALSASASATAALKSMRDRMPADLRNGFDAAPAKRLATARKP